MEEARELAALVMIGVPRKITSYNTLEKLGRVRLSENFFMRDFLYSSIADFYGLPNYPENPKLAVEAGTQLCQNLLEPLKEKFGHVTIRSAYRSPIVNAKGAENGNQHNCASNEANYAGHIWDYRDAEGCMGATSTIVIPWFADRFSEDRPWQSLAWWIHDHLPYSSLCFYPKRAAFNITWHENSERSIYSFIAPKGCLTRQDMGNWDGDHSEHYSWIDETLK